MKARTASPVDSFTQAREKLDALIDWLDSSLEGPQTHDAAEEGIRTQSKEVMRNLYQGFLDRCSQQERQQAERWAEDQTEEVRQGSRPIESLFGRVSLQRQGYRTPWGTGWEYPLDRALNLPKEVYSLPVRERVAEQARHVSLQQTVQSVDRSTGAHVPKRQAEQLVVRAAQDFDAFYTQRSMPANDTVSAQSLLVMSCDGKGITMLPKALRDATRKAQKAARTVAVKGDPMAPKRQRKHDKRMAIVTAVYEQQPHERSAEQVVAGLSHRKGEGSAQRPPRPQNKMVTASVQKSQTQGIQAMFDEAERRDPEHDREVVVLVDGEERQLQKVEQEAKSRKWSVTIVLDLIHVLHYLWKAALALCKAQKLEAEREVQSYLLLLLTGSARDLAAILERQAKKQRLSAKARKSVDKCVEYLRKNHKYLNYRRYLSKGYPIATGVIEGACRHLIQDRMGITGARWDLPGAEAILRLRALWTNGDWDAYWTFHKQQEALRNAPKLAA
jgi:hypothetical protein